MNKSLNQLIESHVRDKYDRMLVRHYQFKYHRVNMDFVFDCDPPVYFPDYRVVSKLFDKLPLINGSFIYKYVGKYSKFIFNSILTNFFKKSISDFYQNHIQFPDEIFVSDKAYKSKDVMGLYLKIFFKLYKKIDLDYSKLTLIELMWFSDQSIKVLTQFVDQSHFFEKDCFPLNEKIKYLTDTFVNGLQSHKHSFEAIVFMTIKANWLDSFEGDLDPIIRMLNSDVNNVLDEFNKITSIYDNKYYQIKKFAYEIKNSKEILYELDNMGEVLFDLIFINYLLMKGKKVYLCAKIILF